MNDDTTGTANSAGRDQALDEGAAVGTDRVHRFVLLVGHTCAPARGTGIEEIGARYRTTPHAAPTVRMMEDGGRAALRYIAQDAPTGYGDAADRLVRALREAGVRVEYRRYVGEVRGEVPDIRPHRRDPRPDERAVPGAPTVAHLVPEHYEHVRRLVGELDGGSGPLIAHTVWETDRMPDHWPALLNAVDRVVVPTEWNRDVFTEGGVTVPITVLPHVACDPTLGDGGIPLDLPDDVVVFYTISRWDQRKQPAAVIHAFAEAFTRADPVALVVKTTPFTQFPIPGGWGGDSGILGTTMLEVARILRDYPNPPLVGCEIEEWEPARIAGLHTRGDCFVSLTHGEGWDLGTFDAATYGNPVITTGWGGALAYLDADASFLVDVDLVPVEHFEPQSYSPKQRWAEPRLDHAVELFREVAADLGAARRRALPQRDRLRADYTPARVVEILPRRRPRARPPDAVAAGSVRRVRSHPTDRALRVRAQEPARPVPPRARTRDRVVPRPRPARRRAPPRTQAAGGAGVGPDRRPRPAPRGRAHAPRCTPRSTPTSTSTATRTPTTPTSSASTCSRSTAASTPTSTRCSSRRSPTSAGRGRS